MGPDTHYTPPMRGGATRNVREFACGFGIIDCIMHEMEVKVVFFLDFVFSLGSFFRQLKGVVWKEGFEWPFTHCAPFVIVIGT